MWLWLMVLKGPWCTCTLKARPWSSPCAWGRRPRAGAKRQTTTAIRALHALRPDVAHLIGVDGEVDVPVAEVLVGDRLVVKPGERFRSSTVGAAGGRSQAHGSTPTAEPLPAEEPGGTTAVARLTVKVVVLQVGAVGVDTVLSSIIRLVEDEQAAKHRYSVGGTKSAPCLCPSCWVWHYLRFLLVGAGALFETAVIHAVAVLVVACPCASGWRCRRPSWPVPAWRPSTAY